MSRFSVEPIALSNNSLFSVDEYNHKSPRNNDQYGTSNYVKESLQSLFSIEPFNICVFRRSASERVDSCSDGVVVEQPGTFRRIKRSREEEWDDKRRMNALN